MPDPAAIPTERLNHILDESSFASGSIYGPYVAKRMAARLLWCEARRVRLEAERDRLRAALEAITDNCLPLGMQDGDYQWRVPGSLMAAGRDALSGGPRL